MSEKEYVDCAVQTDGIVQVDAGVQVDDPAATQHHRMIAAVDIRGGPTTLSELILSPPRSRRRSTSVSLQNQGAYTEQQLSHAGDGDVPDGDSADMGSSIREYKRQPLSYGLPKGRTLKSVSARIVSLPETATSYSAKKAVEKTRRVVSQPERSKYMVHSDASSPFSDRLDISYETLDPFSEAHQRTRVRVRSNATDLPHTPSPPSSPESVVIIADKSQLPKGFLRNALEDDLPSPETTDDG